MDFEEYLQELGDGSARLKVSGLARLSSLSAEHARQLQAAWPGIDVRRQRRIVQELTDLAEDNVELDFDVVFFLGLEDRDAEVRLKSVRGLWEYEGPKLIEPLVRLMENDEDAAVRAEAALGLGRFVVLWEHGRLREKYFREAEAGLRRLLAKDGEALEVRRRALEAIGPYDTAWVRQCIREAYESGDRRMKVSAVHAMGRSCDARWLPLLTRELLSDEPEIRYEAAVACGSLADEAAVPHLIPLLADPDVEVRQVAVTALGEIGGREAKEALTELADSPSAPLREAALAALSTIDFEEDPLAFRFRA